MKNQVLKINSQATIVHHSNRKLVWFSLPELKPIYKFYTKSNFVYVGSDNNILIADKGNIIYATITLPPLEIKEYQRQFLQCNPKGGFCLANTTVLYQSHNITFYSRMPVFSQSYSIEVIQEINQVKASRDQRVLGVTVKQQKNTIFIWDLHQFSNKPKQQLFISQDIVKWEFYLKQMLVVLTTTHLRAYYLQKNQYCLQYYIELNVKACDFQFLQRPKTNDHTGRRSVYPIAILSKNGRVFVYQLYDMQKRIKNSLSNMVASFQVSKRIKKIIYGYQKENSSVVLVFEDQNCNPAVITTNQKFMVLTRKKYLYDLGKQIDFMEYRHGIVLVKQKQEEECIWKIFSHKGRDQIKLLSAVNGRLGILGNRWLYTVDENALSFYTKESGYTQGTAIEFKCPSTLYLLQEEENYTFFISGIRIYKLDFQEKSIKAVGFTVKNEKFKLQHVRTYTRSLLYHVGEEFYLMQYSVVNHKVIIKNIRSSKKKMISLRNSRWAQMDITSITVGQQRKNLVTFDLGKFFKALTKDNVFFEYQLAWTTHDGLLLLVKNYLFVLELVESSQGYSLTPIKRMNTYLHHRFSPDFQIYNILDPRQIVVRQGNRVIRLGSKLGYFVSQDPLSIPDTLLKRQLDMKKHYPPHHPKIINYLIQLGSFTHISKLIKKLYEWIKSQKEIRYFYEEVDEKFFIRYRQEHDQRVVAVIQNQFTEIEMFKQICQNILQDPYKLQLQQNGGLILQSQIESLIFKDQNSRAMDYFSSIVLTQFKSPLMKHKPFQSIHIAYMLHSINKQEAVSILKQQKIDWNWIQKYSIVLWYDHVKQLRQWVEQIGRNQFTRQKQPFDCLLWYTLAGKRGLLAQLFKKNQFSSKQHAGVSNFLQRDLTVLNNQKAAVKNAYALQDKKRYFHSLAFFVLGDKIEQAVNMCLNKLKDINLALLLCLLFGYSKQRIINLLLSEGDIWAQHIAYYLQNKHVDSFNCLFEDQNNEGMEKWDMELKLTGFHPCLVPFGEMIEKSIPVRRQLEEQKMKKEAKNHAQMDIFASFYGSQSQNQENVEVDVEEKTLQPNYQKINTEGCKFFLKNNCPQLALMIQNDNWKAKRAYDLSRYLLIKKISPTVLQIAEQTEDIISIVKSRLQFNHTVSEIIKQHYSKTLKAIQNLFLNELVRLDKYMIGQAIYFCHSFDQLIQILQKNNIRQQYKEQLDRIEPTLLVGKLLIALQLNNYHIVPQILQLTIKWFKYNQKYEVSRHQFWIELKKEYDKLPFLKKDKTQNILDTFEQTFYKFTFQKKKSNGQNFDFKLDMQSCKGIYIKRIIILNLISVLNQKQDIIYSHLTHIAKRYGPLFDKWIGNGVFSDLENQINIMYEQGTLAKMKINYLNEYLGSEFEEMCKALNQLDKAAKSKSIPQPVQILKKMSSFKPNEHNLYKQEAVQIFKNKQDSLSSFAINKNEGSGMELALLFKKNMRKIQVCESLVNRNRSHDGFSLVHDDVPTFDLDQQFKFKGILGKNYPPVVQYSWNSVIENRNQYDGKGIIRGSSKRGNPDYLKSLDQIPYTDISQVSSIQCHHYLPVYLMGGKAVIDICQFSQLKNYNRIKCAGMSQITKISSFEQRVIALDNSGNLSCYSFDSKISGNCVFSVKKAGITDFCCFTPSIYGYCTHNSIHVIDTLLHPKRQCVFKLNMQQPPVAVESFRQSKLIIAKKHDISVYDYRMDVQQDSRDVGGKCKSIVCNHEDKLLVGRQDGKIKMIDLNDKDMDYQIKCLRTADQKDRVSIEQIDIMGKIAIARSSQGSIYLLNSF